MAQNLLAVVPHLHHEFLFLLNFDSFYAYRILITKCEASSLSPRLFHKLYRVLTNIHRPDRAATTTLHIK